MPWPPVKHASCQCMQQALLSRSQPCPWIGLAGVFDHPSLRGPISIHPITLVCFTLRTPKSLHLSNPQNPFFPSSPLCAPEANALTDCNTGLLNFQLCLPNGRLWQEIKGRRGAPGISFTLPSSSGEHLSQHLHPTTLSTATPGGSSTVVPGLKLGNCFYKNFSTCSFSTQGGNGFWLFFPVHHDPLPVPLALPTPP